jgi:hypothetical protein
VKVYKPRHKNYNHQTKAQQRIDGSPFFFALLMAMRTGKTKVIIDNYGRYQLNNKCDDLLVVAPAGSYRTWPAEIEEHGSEQLNRDLAVHLWDAGSSSQRAQRMQAAFMENRGPRALIIDIEALSGVERARELCIQFLDQSRKAMVTIDESTVIKNPESSRGAFVIDKLRPLATYRRIMSGLPTPNSPLDLFSQFYFLNPEILGWSYANYKAYYADIQDICMVPNGLLVSKMERAMQRMPPSQRSADGKKYMINGIGFVEPRDLGRTHLLAELKRMKVYVQQVPVIKGYRHEDELNKLIQPYSYRVKLGDTYDLPPKVYMKREIKLHKEQARVYKELKLQSMAELEMEAFVTPNMVLTRLLRMHQVLCGHVKDDSGVMHEIPEYRTAEIMEILSEYDGKAIIWCSYDYNVRGMAAAIAKEYGADSVARFWGGNRDTREDEEAKFKKTAKCRFMVSTPSAGGRSRTWSVASLLIYLSSTNNLEHRSQSEERGDAVGKYDPITCIDCIAPDTVDVKIIESLRKKIDMAAVITGDNWRQWLI